MYQEAFEKIKESIFPIFYILVEEATTQIGLCGTGFFIDDQGHFLTALHVIDAIPPNAIPQYRGNIPDHIQDPPEVITEIYRDPVRDIFLGNINLHGTVPVSFNLERPRVGKSVCLCGYPFPRLSNNSDGSLNVREVRQYWQPTFIIDIINVVEQEKNYIGFMTQDISLNGMSGGPVFDTEGIVYGVDTAFKHREIPQDNGPTVHVHNGIALGNEFIKDVYAMISASASLTNINTPPQSIWRQIKKTLGFRGTPQRDRTT
jgi:S1-C subfamily serine protease